MTLGRRSTAAADRRRPRLAARLAFLVGSVLLVTGCADDSVSPATTGTTATASASRSSTADADHPEVLAAELTRAGSSRYSLSVTMSSEYDTPERYADGWRVLDPDGKVLGTMELGHDHAAEQPFTRAQDGLEIPEGVDEVTVEGHDLENGYGGGTVTVPVPGA